MPRNKVERDLDNLIEDTLALGQEVEAKLTLVVRVLEDDGDCPDTCWPGGGQELRSSCSSNWNNGSFKSLAEELDWRSLLLQVRHAPVARDLRELCAARALAVHLVRTGDLCGDVLRAVADPPGGPLTGDPGAVVPRMTVLAHGIFREGLSAFEHQDMARAKGLRATDDGVRVAVAQDLTLRTRGAGTGFLLTTLITSLEDLVDRGFGQAELAGYLALR